MVNKVTRSKWKYNIFGGENGWDQWEKWDYFDAKR